METKTKWMLIVSGAGLVSFGVGLLIGRQFPVHHYVRFNEGRYLLDTSTGKVCDPLKDPLDALNDDLGVNSNPVPACNKK